MPRFNALHVAGIAASLSLSLLAGCATPVVPVPATGTSSTAPAAPAVATPAAPAVETPAMPAPAAATPQTISGVATFRGEPLAGYAVTVLDARTGKAVPATGDLGAATGLAVERQGLVTDAQGGFAVRLVGLGAGQALRVVVKSGNAALEAVVGANMQAFGAAGYRTLDVGGAIAVDERSTAIAQIASGVLLTTGLLSPEAAAAIIAKLATQLAALAPQLAAAIQAAPPMANGLVSTTGTEAASAVKTLVSNVGATKALTQTVAALVAEIAKAAPAGAPNAELKAALGQINFVGTVLEGGLTEGGLTLTNTLNGVSVAAGSGDVATVSAQTSSSGGHSGSGAATLPPPTLTPIPTEPGTMVATFAELKAAIEVDHATAVTFSADIETGENDYQLDLPQAVVIHGAGHRLWGDFIPTFNGAAVTLENMKVSTHLRIQPTSAAEEVRLDHVTFDSKQSSVSDFINQGTVEFFGPAPLTVTYCSFTDTLQGGFYDNCLDVSRDDNAPLLIYHNTFESRVYSDGFPNNNEMGNALSIYDIARTTIRDNTFVNFRDTVTLKLAHDGTDPENFDTTTITGNRFDAPLFEAIYLEYGFDGTQPAVYGQLLRRITQNTFSGGVYPLFYEASFPFTDDEAYFTGHNTFNHVQNPIYARYSPLVD